jgi:hypothetical protein
MTTQEELDEVYPTTVSRTFIWVVIIMMAGSVFNSDVWVALAAVKLIGDGSVAWLERRYHRG